MVHMDNSGILRKVKQAFIGSGGVTVELSVKMTFEKDWMGTIPQECLWKSFQVYSK
jgi:hypothetical protein